MAAPAEKGSITKNSRETASRKKAARAKDTGTTTTASTETKVKSTRKTKATGTTTKKRKATTTTGKVKRNVRRATTDVGDPLAGLKNIGLTEGSTTASGNYTAPVAKYGGTGSIGLVDVGSLQPTDLFSASSNLPYVAPEQFDGEFEKLSGQRRAVTILRENLALVLDLEKAEGDQIKIGIQRQKNATLGIEFQTAQVDTQIAGLVLDGRQIKLEHTDVNNQIAQQRLNQAMGDLNGETQVTQLRAQTWEIKLEGLRVGITEARNALSKKGRELEGSTFN